MPLSSQVGRTWSSTRLGLQRGLLEGMLHAAECAVVMHESWLPAEEEEEEEDPLGGSSQGLTGAWGGGATAEAVAGVVTDEDVQVRCGTRYFCVHAVETSVSSIQPPLHFPPRRMYHANKALSLTSPFSYFALPASSPRLMLGCRAFCWP